MIGLENTINQIFKYQGALQEHLAKFTRPQRLTAKVGKFILDIMDDTVTDTTTTPTTTTTSAIDTIARISNLAKFKCAANAKVPMKGVSWTDPKNQTAIKPKGNHGVVCGPASNLIVLDVDVKDDGLAEMQDYIKKTTVG